jgi:hypothetical protein
MIRRLFHRWEVRLAEQDQNRVIRPFEWGVDFIGADQPGADPLSDLKNYAKAALRDSDTHYQYPRVTEYTVAGSHLKFPSPYPSPYGKNNTVHGRHFPVESDGRVVIVLPQWNSDSNGHMALCRLLNRFGLSALRLSLPYHDLRMPEELAARCTPCGRRSWTRGRHWIGSKQSGIVNSRYWAPAWDPASP